MSRSVVYFGYLGDEGTDAGVVRQRLSFMDRQLQWLSGLIEASPECFRLIVAYVAPRAWDADVHAAITRHGFAVDPASVLAERRNSFEYPGFRALKTLAASSAPDHLIYYCHSKGIVELAESKMGLFRLHSAMGLTANLDRLAASPELNRAGLFPSRWGWCWYNFFWIKAGYMAGRPVSESTDRYEFEALIGDRTDKQGYQAVMPLTDRFPFEAMGIAIQPWYRPAETTSPELDAAYYAYAGLPSSAALA